MNETSHIDNDTFDYLKPDKLKAGSFYLLPKIHKVNNPVRPIVSANGHPTEKISEFVDFRLRPHVEALSSHLKDTTDYLLNMESMNPLPSILFSMDVMSLCTSILQYDGVERPGIKEPLKNHQRKVLSSCSHWYWSVTILHLMENILYKSTEPLWEQRWHLHGEPWKTNYTIFTQKPLSWSRVIDDIDMKWTESKENLHRFFDNTNNVHSTIKFTHKTSRTNIWMLTLPVKMIFDI